MIRAKRIYEIPQKSDGFRILVDRLWPRRMSKEKAKIDLWLKEIAPSEELRKWFAHDPKKWEELKNRYTKELASKKELLAEIKKLEKEKKIITFLYGTKDEKHNNAIALLEIIRKN